MVLRIWVRAITQCLPWLPLYFSCCNFCHSPIVNSSATTTIRFLESLRTSSSRLSVSTTTSMIVAECARLHVSQLQAHKYKYNKMAGPSRFSYAVIKQMLFSARQQSVLEEYLRRVYLPMGASSFNTPNWTTGPRAPQVPLVAEYLLMGAPENSREPFLDYCRVPGVLRQPEGRHQPRPSAQSVRRGHAGAGARPGRRGRRSVRGTTAGCSTTSQYALREQGLRWAVQMIFVISKR